MKDKFGRNINYLRISLTSKCNLKCIYCIAEDVSLQDNYNNEELSFEDYKFLIKSMSELGIEKVRFTGGEPLLYPNLVELIRFTKEECNIEDIAITTNGIGLYEIINDIADYGVKKVNITLNSLKEYKYKDITRGGSLKEVLRGINVCVKLGIEVNINCVPMYSFNDDEIYDFISMTNYYPINVRFIDFGHKSSIDIKSILAQMEDIRPLQSQKDSLAQYYKLIGSKGKVGVIDPLRSTKCNTCNKIRITSKGTVKTCINSSDEVDIKKYLQKPLMFREVMKDIISNRSMNSSFL